MAGVALLLGMLPGAASAQVGSARYSAVVMEPRSGNLLIANSPDELRHPASLTKMMTLYMLFDAMRAGYISLDTPLVMTPTAASRPPSKLGLPVGRSITVEQGIYALVTKSANDVASLIGETLGGGDEYRFAQMMTLRARAIGMTRTTFRNASGLPDIEQVTTARDMATLGRRLQHDFPDRYHYFGTRQVRLGSISLRNHNRMLESYEGTDGIKTGYIDASGFNIVTSAKRENVRLIAAVFGGSSWTERDRQTALLLDQGFVQMGVNGSGRAPLVASQTGRAAVVAAAAGTTAAIARRRGRAPVMVSQAAAAPVPQRAGRVRLVSTGMAAPVRPVAVPTARVSRPAARPQPSRQRVAVQARATTRRVVEQGDGGPARATARAQRTPVRVAARAPARASAPVRRPAPR
ncbi:D-alanyl-D-alanine carboxypeptidase [Roseomonas marmotae]|uniref:D-alanyl-D-alanine carboxypeptidase n=2 Tax=Roseomonas marmotae TaxID=2768161 RepID=A0ABS3KH66_9PROT|nr:D-alanyl-D-alanine carboxypeptidase [Roseomonas marmotae]QTI80991.1 D-alanyl-D-alanine carboxypeptidase [Roseomonas marmotae]